MRLSCARASCIFVVSISGVLAGCTSVIEPPKKPFSDYAPQKKIDLTVGVRITEDLKKAKWEKDLSEIPIGTWVAPNAKRLAEHVFARAVDVDGSTPAVGSGVDAILTPRVVFINRTLGATSIGDSHIGVKVEWDLRTLSGQPIWIETTSGEASGSTGWTYPETILEKALNQLQKNTQAAMNSSQSIARYAAKK